MQKVHLLPESFYMKSHLLLAALAIVGASAQATSYTDRASFNAATTIAYTQDFETLSGTASFTGPLSFADGLTVSSPSNNLFSVGVGQSSNSTEAIGSNYPPSDYLQFGLGGNFRAFGADFFENFGGGAQHSGPSTFQLTFFSGTTSVGSVTGLVAPNGGSFIGFTSSTFFNSVQVLSLDNSYEVADNVSVGNVSAVPEPESYAMLLAGLGLVGLMVKRRKAKQA